MQSWRAQCNYIPPLFCCNAPLLRTLPPLGRLCRLEGSIPAGWQLNDGLAILTACGNRLTGSIPADWALPATLRSLYLFNNSLQVCKGVLSARAFCLQGHFVWSGLVMQLAAARQSARALLCL